MGIFEDKELNMNPIKKTITLADGREITLETGKLAKQADGAVELRMGNTMLLATVVSAKEAGEGVDFMPLQQREILGSRPLPWRFPETRGTLVRLRNSDFPPRRPRASSAVP